MIIPHWGRVLRLPGAQASFTVSRLGRKALPHCQIQQQHFLSFPAGRKMTRANFRRTCGTMRVRKATDLLREWGKKTPRLPTCRIPGKWNHCHMIWYLLTIFLSVWLYLSGWWEKRGWRGLIRVPSGYTPVCVHRVLPAAALRPGIPTIPPSLLSAPWAPGLPAASWLSQRIPPAPKITHPSAG